MVTCGNFFFFFTLQYYSEFKKQKWRSEYQTLLEERNKGFFIKTKCKKNIIHPYELIRLSSFNYFSLCFFYTKLEIFFFFLVKKLFFLSFAASNSKHQLKKQKHSSEGLFL